LVSDNTILGLDIGTSKICAVAGIPLPDGSVRFTAHSEQKSEGVRAGNVINLETVLKTIKSVVEDVELNTGSEVKQIVTGVSGSHIEGLFSQGVVGINSKDQEIHKEDIYRSMEVARAFELPLDREILHTLVQDFCIDGRSGIKDPVDMVGHRLETKVMIVTGSVAFSQNLDKCFERLHYTVKRRMLQQLADSEALLTTEEREMGTLLINMGAGMTNMIGFVHGAPVYVGGVDIGGDQVTSDLSYILNQPPQLVEEVKTQFGCCYEPIIDPHETIIIPQAGRLPSIKMPRRELSKIIEPRVAEIFAMLRGLLEKRGLLHTFGGGIVLTGGGAMAPGTSQLATELFDIQARRARFTQLNGFETGFSDLRYSTAIGMVLYDANRQSTNEVGNYQKTRPTVSGKGVGGRIKNFFDVLF